jgi:hypothetical protein
LLLVEKATYVACPQQKNSNDCSLFAMVTLLHLAKKVPIHDKLYNQNDISCFRMALGELLNRKKIKPPPLTELSCNVVKYFFPLLHNGNKEEPINFPNDMHFCYLKLLDKQQKLTMRKTPTKTPKS